MMFAKNPPIRNKQWLKAVHEIECCVRCGKFGIEAAHRDESKGMGQKTSDHLTAALCKACHHELGNGNKMPRDERRSEMDRCIVLTFDKLVQLGRIGVTP